MQSKRRKFLKVLILKSGETFVGWNKRKQTYYNNIDKETRKQNNKNKYFQSNYESAEMKLQKKEKLS